MFRLSAPDRWSFLAMLAIGVSVLGLIMGGNFAIGPAFFLFGFAFLLLSVVYIILFIAALFKFRTKSALSLLIGALLAFAFIKTGVRISELANLLVFFLNEQHYDKLVDRERSRAAGAPVRVVVSWSDRSLFVTSTQFYYVIYDETNEAGRDASTIAGYWPYAASPTGKIDVSGLKSVDHLAGHYFGFWLSY